MTQPSTRYQNAVALTLALIEQEQADGVAGFSTGATAHQVARKLVGTQTADSVQRILRVLERDGRVKHRQASRGPNGAYIYYTVKPAVATELTDASPPA